MPPFFVIHKRKQIIQAWNKMKASKLWAGIFFVNCTFKKKVYIFYTVVMCTHTFLDKWIWLLSICSWASVYLCEIIQTIHHLCTGARRSVNFMPGVCLNEPVSLWPFFCSVSLCHFEHCTRHTLYSAVSSVNKEVSGPDPEHFTSYW